MHATSAVAVAVVAAAGAIAVPMNSGIFARGMSSSPLMPVDESLAAPKNAFGQAPSAPTNENPHLRALPTVTVVYPPKATMCKAGQVPSVNRNHHRHKGSHHKGGDPSMDRNRNGHSLAGHDREGHNREGHHEEGHHDEGARNPRGDGGHAKDGALSAAPALVPRSDAPVPTSAVAGLAESAPVPTPHPKHKNGRHRRGTHTKTGTDGIVTVFSKGSNTPCYAAPTGVPASGKTHKYKSHHEGHKEDRRLPTNLSPPKGKSNTVVAPGRDNKRALVKRAVDLLERYFNDLDELD